MCIDVLCREVVFFLEVILYGVCIDVLCREVVFFLEVILYGVCIERSFVGRFVLFQSVQYQRFHYRP